MGRRRKPKVANVPRHRSEDPNSNIAAPQPQLINELGHNKEFAQRYEASKRKQLLASAPAALLNESDASQESSSSEEEDEFGELLTKGIDRRVRQTLEAIRRKDPKIYDKSTRFFEHEGNEEENDGDRENEGEDSAGSDDEPVAGWDVIESAANADVKKLTVKDYVRQNLLKDGKLSDTEDDDDGLEEHVEGDGLGNIDKSPKEGRKGERGLYTIGDAHHNAKDAKRTNGAVNAASANTAEAENGDSESEDSGDEFFTQKSKTAEEIEEEEHDFQIFLQKKAKKNAHRAGEDLLLHSYLENEKPDEKERFLRDFVLNNGWLDRNAGDAPRVDEYEIEVDTVDPDKRSDGDEEEAQNEDDEFEDKLDKFEAQYNFRFEDPEGTQIVSHGREISYSMRRPDDRRKRAREARRLRKKQEKIGKVEEIKRLKNLKRKEIEARLIAIQEAAGDGVDLSGIDLDGDFDPDEFNQQMEQKFGDEYYAANDEEMKGLTEEGVATASERRVEGKRSGEVSEDIRADVNKLVDEYYDLNYEDIVGGTPVRFKYKKVEAEAFNMSAEDILGLEDKELNRLVSMKYLAPYRSVRDTKKQSWRVREKLQRLKQGKRKDGGASGKECGIQALVDAEAEKREGIRGDLGESGKRKRRERGGEGGKGERQEQDKRVENDGSNGGMSGNDVNESQEQQGGKKKAIHPSPQRKRRKKKGIRDEADGGLSEKRKEAYALALSGGPL